MPSRTIILFKPTDAEDPSSGMESLGSVKRIIDALEPFNTAPDGSKGEALGSLTLYGPGLVMDLPTSAESITQLLVRVDEEETAWLVLARLCSNKGWKMMDPESGRTFM